MLFGNNFYGLQPRLWRDRVGVDDWVTGFVSVVRVEGQNRVAALIPIMPLVEYHFPPVEWFHHDAGLL